MYYGNRCQLCRSNDNSKNFLLLASGVDANEEVIKICSVCNEFLEKQLDEQIRLLIAKRDD